MSITRGLRILVADDHQTTAIGLRDLFVKRGHTAEAVHDGQSALDAVLQFNPQLAVLDLSMPGIDGYELTRRIRSQPGGDSIVIIIVSGHGGAGAKDEAAAAGADHFLPKPVDFDALWQILDDTVRNVFGS